MSACPPLDILHLIDSAGLAGGERYLLDLIRYSGPPFRHRVVLYRPGPLEEMLEQEGIAVTRIPMTGRFSLSALSRVRRILCRERIPILHSHGYRSNLLGRLAGIGSAARRIVTVHVSLYDYVDTPPFLRQVYLGIERMTSPLTAKYICISQAMRKDLLRMGIPEAKLVLIPNGVDLERFHPRPPDETLRRALGVQGRSPLIGTAGRMVTEKNQADLIDALPVLRQRWPGLRCLFIGDGPLRPALEERAGRLGLSDACLFTGTRRDIAELYSLLDLFVLPSRREPFGLVLLEAMASQVPVVATAAGGPLDLIRSGANGLLVAPSDARELASGIDFLLSNPEQAKAMAVQGYETVWKGYRIQDTARRIGDLYQAQAPSPRVHANPGGHGRDVSLTHPQRPLSSLEAFEGTKILVVLIAGIGDLIMASPGFRAIRNGHPEAKICLLTSTDALPIARHYPVLDEVIPFPIRELRNHRRHLLSVARLLRTLRKRRFDVAVNLFRVGSWQGALKMGMLFLASGAKKRIGHGRHGFGLFLTDTVPAETFANRHVVEAIGDIAAKIGGVPDGREIEVFWSAASDAKWEPFFNSLNGASAVGIHPGGDRESKRWPPERFAAVASALAERYRARIVLLGGPADTPLAERIERGLAATVAAANLAGKVPLDELPCLIHRFDLLITNDSGPMHIAAATRTPLVAVFGPGDPVLNRPYADPEGYRLVRKEVPCHRPCELKSCPHRSCLDLISPEEVLEACSEILGGGAASLWTPPHIPPTVGT